MKIKIFLNSLLAVVIGLVMFAPSTLAAAFGVSPPWVTNENLKPGSNFVYEIDLSTNDPSETMTVKTRLTGDPEILKWVSIRDKDTLTMPKGKYYVPMYVHVNVPKDAKVGKYKGGIMVTVIPQTTPKEDVAIYLGGHISVNLEVVNYDVTDFVVKSTSIKTITEGQNMNLYMKLKNIGNTVLTSVKTKLDITDYKTGAKVASASTDKLPKPIQPQTVGEVDFSIPTQDLKAGKYWVNISTLNNGKQIYQNRLYLAVNESGINNVLKTSVKVGTKEDVLKAAATSTATTTTTTPTTLTTSTTSGLIAKTMQPNDVMVKTTVTVRAPLTNKLIGVVIILLGILIILTVKFNLHQKVRRRR